MSKLDFSRRWPVEVRNPQTGVKERQLAVASSWEANELVVYTEGPNDTLLAHLTGPRGLVRFPAYDRAKNPGAGAAITASSALSALSPDAETLPGREVLHEGE